MKLTKTFTVPAAILTTLVVTACDGSFSPDYAAERTREEANKTLVDTALTGFYVEGDASFGDRYIAQDYIQHNPLGMNGLDFVKSIFIDGRPDNLVVEMPFIMSDGEYVLQHSRFTGFTAFYERPIIAVDVYRIEDGMLVEHWDVVQEEVYPEETESGNAMFPIEANNDVVSEAQEKRNAQMVREAITGLVAGDESVLDRHFSPDYINHNPDATNGLDSLRGFSEGNLPQEFEFDIGFVIADGPYVAIQTRGAGFGPVPVITFDIFRVENDLIVEHWDVMQDEVTAENSASGNAMFPIE